MLFNENEIPDFFKNFKVKTDVSRQEARKDKLSYEEFERIIKFFTEDKVIRTYIALAFESLARPQEICYTRLRDLEIYDNYAYVNISEHGKEGIKKLLSIDSFPYILKMYEEHPNKNNKDAFLFLNKHKEQLTPFAINRKIRLACKKLGIEKPITCYSIKRFGVTFRRLQGDDDVTIQRIAGWKSTEQLRRYDLSNQEDVFKIELAKRGLIKDEKLKRYTPKTKTITFKITKRDHKF